MLMTRLAIILAAPCYSMRFFIFLDVLVSITSFCRNANPIAAMASFVTQGMAKDR